MLYKRSTIKKAESLNRQDKKLKRSCPFCDIENQVEEVLDGNKTMSVIRNRVSYDFFEGVPISDHLMIIPRQHHTNLGEFSAAEKHDYMELLSEYESKGYSVYSRGVSNHERSQPHLHTHLLMAEGRRSRYIFFSLKPYILLASKPKTGKRW